MSSLQALINKIADDNLRSQIQEQVSKLLAKKRFGLVWEDHLPECVPLYDVDILAGMSVAKKDAYIDEVFTVTKIDGNVATCVLQGSTDGAEQTFLISEIVAVAKFGEPIYPSLKTIDTIENAPGDPLHHILIEGENYHALQLLQYMYKGKVDCIYIDPPYNTGAKDWKYNNDYVDSSDKFRHSKWLSIKFARQDANTAL